MATSKQQYLDWAQKVIDGAGDNDTLSFKLRSEKVENFAKDIDYIDHEIGKLLHERALLLNGVAENAHEVQQLLIKKLEGK